MKIYICPICGEQKSVEYKSVNGGYWWCYKCMKEIIPLATPQEVR